MVDRRKITKNECKAMFGEVIDDIVTLTDDRTDSNRTRAVDKLTEAVERLLGHIDYSRP
jgi:hypothetical protein